MKEFFQHLNKIAKPRRNDIIEKDYHLHRLLKRLSEDDYFGERLVLKGGTCLVKAYIGYYRFSEDLDFTWKDQGAWKDMSATKVRRRCSREVSEAIEHLAEISDDLGLTFPGDKSDTSQVVMSSGGRMPRFYIKYQSEMLARPTNMKVEINFVDEHLYPFQTRELGTYLQGKASEETEFLFKEQWDEYTRPIRIECYDPQEIYTEKARAALTRVKYKLRDIIDIYILQQKFGYTLPRYRNQIIEKVQYMNNIYKRFREALETRTLLHIEDVPQEELELLTIKIPPDLEDNIQQIHQQIRQIQQDLQK